MKKKEGTAALRPLLQRYGLDAPLPPEIRERIAGDYGRIYGKISEKTSRPAVIAALAAWIFFLVKKTGVPVPMAKFAAAMVVAVSLGTGAYFALNTPAHAPAAPAAPSVRCAVTIRPFVSRSFDQSTGTVCAGALNRALDDKYGRGFSRLASSPGMGEARWAVFGTVENISGSAVMIVKIIDARTSRTVFMAEEKCGAPGNCGQAAARLVEKFPGLKDR